MKRLLLSIVLALFLAACSSTATPVLTGDDVANAFKDAGLEAENVRPLTREEYGLAPFVGTGTRFFVPSLGENNGGRIIVTETAEDADLIEAFYVEAGQQSALFFSHVFRNGNIVVQINGDLPDETAAEYEAALMSLTP